MRPPRAAPRAAARRFAVQVGAGVFAHPPRSPNDVERWDEPCPDTTEHERHPWHLYHWRGCPGIPIIVDPEEGG